MLKHLGNNPPRITDSGRRYSFTYMSMVFKNGQATYFVFTLQRFYHFFAFPQGKASQSSDNWEKLMRKKLFFVPPFPLQIEFHLSAVTLTTYLETFCAKQS